MAYVSPHWFLDVWQKEDNDAVQFVERYIDSRFRLIFEKETKFLKQLKRGSAIYTVKPEWMEQRGYPRVITAQCTGGNAITFSGTFNGQALTAALMKQIVRYGTVLQKRISGVTHQVKITDTDFTDLTLSAAAYGNTTFSNDAAAVEYQIVSEPWADPRDFGHPRALPRDLRFTFTQIFAEQFTIHRTEEKLRKYLVKDETQHQVDMLLRKLKDQQASAAVLSRPYHDGSAYKTAFDVQDATWAGLMWWPEYVQSQQANPTIYIDAANQGLTKGMVDKLAWAGYRTEQCDYSKGGWQIWCNPAIRPYFHEMLAEQRQWDMKQTTAGYAVNELQLECGAKMPVDEDMVFPSDVMVMLPTDEIEYGPFADDTLKREPVEGGSPRYKQWLISFQDWGLMPYNPRNILVIYNIQAHPNM